MKLNSKNNSLRNHKSGMTLLELTVVILVLLSLISILFIGARAWKAGSDRAGCIINLRNAQQAVRSYQNMNAYPEGKTINMFTDIFGAGGYGVETKCPAGGDYDHAGAIPPVGTLAMVCSLAGTDGHVPTGSDGW